MKNDFGLFFKMLTRHKQLRWMGFLAILFGVIGALQIAIINHDLLNKFIMIPLWGMISTGTLAMIFGSQIILYDGDAWDFVMTHEVSDRQYIKTKLYLIRWMIVIQAVVTAPFASLSLMVDVSNLLIYLSIFAFNLGVFAPLMLTFSIQQGKLSSLEKPAPHSAYILLYIYPVILLLGLVFGFANSMHVATIGLLVLGGSGLLMSGMVVNRIVAYFLVKKYKYGEIL